MANSAQVGVILVVLVPSSTKPGVVWCLSADGQAGLPRRAVLAGKTTQETASELLYSHTGYRGRVNGRGFANLVQCPLEEVVGEGGLQVAVPYKVTLGDALLHPNDMPKGRLVDLGEAMMTFSPADKLVLAQAINAV